MNRTGFWILLFAAASVFFGWETYRAWEGPVLPGKEAPEGKPFPLPSAGDIPKAPAGNAQYAGLSSVIARPVFRPDRRPFQGASGAVPQRNHEAELARYTVLGVLMTGDERKAVVVSNAPGNAGRWEVGAGDDLPGFTVKEVGPDGIVLTADDREFSLPLYAGGPKGPGGGVFRTETGPAPPRSVPGAVRPPAPAVATPSPQHEQPPAVPQIPQRTYPQRYLPGRR